MTSTITLFYHKLIKFQIPLPWSFLQAIQDLLQLANQILLTFDLIPLWLLYINLFLQIPMEKGFFTSNFSRCKSSTTARLKIVLIEVILTTGEKYFIKVYTFLLCKPLYNKSSLVSLLSFIFFLQTVNSFILQCPFFSGNLTRAQVWFLTNESISSSMPCSHFFLVSTCIASS